MSEDFKIKAGVPMPRDGVRLTDVLRQLAKANIGDSVFIPGRRPGEIGGFAAAAAGKGWHISRRENGGTRVWKRAEPAQ